VKRRFKFLSAIYKQLKEYNDTDGSYRTCEAEKLLYSELCILEAKQKGILKLCLRRERRNEADITNKIHKSHMRKMPAVRWRLRANKKNYYEEMKR